MRRCLRLAYDRVLAIVSAIAATEYDDYDASRQALSC